MRLTRALVVLAACARPVLDTAVAPIDADGDGWLDVDDCDDANHLVHPEARERCDLLDNDCDGEVDEGLGGRWWSDDDRDGWGGEHLVDVCDPYDRGVSERGGDCDDGDPLVHPEAPERCDGIDNDCDPSTRELGRVMRLDHDDAVDVTDLFAGTPERPATPALRSGTLHLCGGTHTVHASIGSAVLTGSLAATLSGGGTGRPLTVLPEASANVRGIALVDGSADRGGALWCDAARVRLDDVQIARSTARLGGGIAVGPTCSLSGDAVWVHDTVAEDGGGLYGAAHLTASRIERATATGRGGGFAGGARLEESEVRDCSATLGGGGYGDAAVDLRDTVLRGNVAAAGGGLYLDLGARVPLGQGLFGTRFEGNTASGGSGAAEDGRGGGVYAVGVDLELTSASLSENEASADGGAIWIASGALTLGDVRIADNRSGGAGGGLALAGGVESVWTGGELQGNVATWGGGVWFAGDSLAVVGVTFAGNEPGHVHHASAGAIEGVGGSLACDGDGCAWK